MPNVKHERISWTRSYCLCEVVSIKLTIFWRGISEELTYLCSFCKHFDVIFKAELLTFKGARAGQWPKKKRNASESISVPDKRESRKWLTWKIKIDWCNLAPWKFKDRETRKWKMNQCDIRSERASFFPVGFFGKSQRSPTRSSCGNIIRWLLQLYGGYLKRWMTDGADDRSANTYNATDVYRNGKVL